MSSPIVRLFEGLPGVGSTLEEAIAGGSAADRFGLAFSAGYAAALRALVPDLPRDERAALCATEEGGAHPRAILTKFEYGRVSGTKTFVTGGTEAVRLLVVAREESGPLRVVKVDARGPGVTLKPLPATPFAPEIPHAAVTLEGAPAVALPGDGYTDYLKPFRTIEDIHVMLAATAYLVALGRRAGMWAADLASLSAVAAALVTLGGEPRLAASTHVALEGVLVWFRSVVERLDLAGASDEERARWERDRGLLRVAEKVRALRFTSACEALGLRLA